MKFSTLKKILVICGYVAISCSHVAVEAKSNKGRKTQAITKAFLAKAEKLSKKFISHWYPGRHLDHICMYELVDVLDKLKIAFFDTKQNKESFLIHITRLIGFKAIMRQKLNDKKALQEDFEKYEDEYKTFLGKNITFAKFETFLEGLYDNFCLLCNDLTNKKVQKSALKIGTAFTRFQSRLPKSFVKRMEKQAGSSSISVREALMAIRRRIKLK